jgi:hypothetical protein
VAPPEAGASIKHRRLIVLLLACHVGCAASQVEDEPEGGEPPELPPSRGWTKEQKALALNGAIAGAVALYGTGFWDYGGKSFNVAHEGWFGKDTAYGGADKLGHAYATYLTTLGLSTIYENWGFERRQADALGALSAFGAFTLVEVGDAYSKNGFSYEDIVMDAAGAAFGYARRRSPLLKRFLDFRVEYFPSRTVTEGGRMDLATDYSGYKFLFAFKLEGFERLQPSWLKYVEIHLGYYTRGYLTADQPYYDGKTRRGYVAVGFNLARLFRKTGQKTLSTIFTFYQAPYTYVPTGGYR